MFHKLEVRDRSQSLVGGPDAKKGALKHFDLLRGGLEKNDHKFSCENWIYKISYGVDP